MDTNWIDDLARMLASDASRRQIFRNMFAAATGGALASPARSAFGQGEAEPLGEADGVIFLPIVQGGRGTSALLCPVASTCANKHFCSDNQSCRCLMSDEGVIRCGSIPGCNVPKCTTSADCAHLGEGYFCDTPYSGCCGDELQRCIAPCTDELTPCPPERRCNFSCCPEGQICFADACRAAVFGAMTGLWSGTIAYEGETVGVRFVMQEVEGYLEGKMEYVDPVTQALLDSGEVTGNKYDSYVAWDMASGSWVEGDVSADGKTFTGQYEFLSANDEAGISAELKLTKASTAAGMDAWMAAHINAY